MVSEGDSGKERHGSLGVTGPVEPAPPAAGGVAVGEDEDSSGGFGGVFHSSLLSRLLCLSSGNDTRGSPGVGSVAAEAFCLLIFYCSTGANEPEMPPGGDILVS
jgi:hypothetical protein